MSKGVVTRKDLFEDEAMKFGEVLVKQFQMTIEKSEELKKSLKEYERIFNSLKKSTDNTSLYNSMKEEKLLFLQNINAIKEREAAEKSFIKVQQEETKVLQEKIKAEKLKLQLDNQRAAQQKRNIELTVEEKIQNQLASKAEREAALDKLGLVGAYDKLNKARSEAKSKLRDLIIAEGEHSASVKKAQKEYDELDARVRKADKAVGDFTKNVGNYPTLSNITSNLTELLSALGAFAGVSSAFDVLKDGLNTIVEFDQAVSDLKAITGATGKDLKFLRQQAVELGKSTKGGAVQVVEAYKLIASAKPELLENVEALNSVTEATLILSKASGLELPDAAARLTDAMNQFGASAEEANRYIDTLANGAKYGSAEIPNVTDALLKFGAVAKSSNISIEESTALIELLAEKGQKGAEAGTSLRNVLLKISAPDTLPKEALAVFDKFGISIEKLKDNTLPIQDRLEMLKPILVDNSNLVKIFGQENIVAARNVLENTDRLKELTSKMSEFGTAQKQAEERSNTLQGKIDSLSATYDSFIINLNEGRGVISKLFVLFADGVKYALEGLIKLNSTWDELLDKSRKEGIKSGSKVFKERFNLMGGNIKELSDEARKSVRAQLSVIQEEISKGNKDSKLLEEKNRLISLLGANPEGIAKSIKESSKNRLKELQDELSKLHKEAAEKSKHLSESDREYFIKRTVDPARKRELLREIQEEASIIKEANKKITHLKSGIAKDSEQKTSTEPVDDKKAEEARRKAIEIKKQLNASEYELDKQRLEQHIEIANEIAQNEKEADAVRIEAINNRTTKEKELLDLTKKYELQKEKDNYKELLIENKDNVKNIEVIEKQHAINKKIINEDFLFETKEAEKKKAEEIKKIREFDFDSYSKILEEKSTRNVISMNSELQKENERFKSLGDITKMSQNKQEKILEEHEKKKLDIKKKYAVEGVKIQIKNLEDTLSAYDSLPENEKTSSEKRLDIAKQLSEAKLKLSEFEVEKNEENNEKKKYSDKEWAEAILNVSQNITSAMGQLGNAYFESRTANIDEDIKKNDEYYSKQIELASNDKRKKEELEKDAEKKRKQLEDKKKKEQYQQAVFNKTLSAVQIGISTAQAIMQSYAQLGPIGGSAGAILAGVVGAIQLAAVLAAPIPKYKDGRQGGRKELAIVGDGGKHEVIERASGKIELTPATDTLVQLYENDKVHSSIEEYNRALRVANKMSLVSEINKIKDYDLKKTLNSLYDQEVLNELKRNTQAIREGKTTVNNNIKVDLNHHLWKIKNNTWN
ncbi:phage tail tape measure protein [Flavobacterium oreochromis]|uniref:phage tail tape measure protein n=1 Tax=Flavobacterium oreochromis TaxID=2906078 RepID=UPI001CE67EBE|nr:phage tail tape measure protein [Flavobacterium oreochromis]QYS85407.1 phage tail tape measure protein [Flavobacterium oreochromis]